MRTTFEDIKGKLDNSLYKNEEQIRFSLVARVLEKLDWKIWDPQEVATEFSPNNGRHKVDIALFPSQYEIPIYIEIKAASKLNKPTELLKAENQLRDYNVDLTALFTILTDGNQWRFYYSQAGGTFSQKCFKTINIQKDDYDDTEFSFLSFLSKNEIVNGNAKKEANEYLQLSRKQRIMEESLLNAKREQDKNPFLNLVDALCEVVNLKGHNITQTEAIEFLKRANNKKQSKANIAIPKFQTSPETNQIEDAKSIYNEKDFRTYSVNSKPDLRFTKIKFGKIENELAKNWQKLLRILLKHIILKGVTIQDIRKKFVLNLENGTPKERNFYTIPDTNYSLQNVSASVAGEAIVKLADSYNIKVEINFVWLNKPDKAAFPNEQGKLIV